MSYKILAAVWLTGLIMFAVCAVGDPIKPRTPGETYSWHVPVGMITITVPLAILAYMAGRDDSNH